MTIKEQIDKAFQKAVEEFNRGKLTRIEPTGAEKFYFTAGVIDGIRIGKGEE